MKKLNILFICRANCFRSKIAEAYFKKINKNKSIKVKSAGIIPGYGLNKNQANAARELGIIIRGNSKGVNASLLKWADLLVIVADDVPPNIFDYEKRKKYIKLITWKIKDVKSSRDIEDNKRATKQIIKKVDSLNKKLEARK
jgi:protein-tyrosine-phosphatase